MGLFSFVKSAGEKVLDTLSGGSKSEKLQDHIDKLNLPGSDQVKLDVNDDGTVTMTGDGVSQALKEKIMVAVGNVEGISGVNDHVTASGSDAQSTYYTVKSGDTLSAIAKSQYGNANDYMRIFEANKPMLSHPDKIYPGQVLIIPQK